MSKPPAFQFYANDWLSSTKISVMTPAQEGAYIRLLAHAWNDPDCSIPDDDDQLAMLSRLGEQWLKGSSSLVRSCFVKHPHISGRLVNEKLLQVRENSDNWREKCREAGAKSGRIRRLRSAKGSSTKVRTKRELNTNTSSSSSNKPYSPFDTSDFDVFWAAYPARNGKKIGKADAAEKFAKLAAKDVPLVLVAVAAYAAHIKKTTGYAKDAKRWLANDNWREWAESTEVDDPGFEYWKKPEAAK